MTEGGQTKPSSQKPRTKLPEQKTPRTNTNPPVKTYVCMHVLLKMGGGPRRVTYFKGVPRCVTKCDRGRG